MVSPVTLEHTRTIVDPRYGAKLTGKVGDTTLGLIVADVDAAGRRVDATDPDFGKSAQFLIGRARYELDTASHIGAIVTDREFLDSYNRVAGVDGQFRLSRADTLNVIFVQSDTRRGDGERLSGPMWGTLYRHTGRHLRGQMFLGSPTPVSLPTRGSFSGSTPSWLVSTRAIAGGRRAGSSTGARTSMPPGTTPSTMYSKTSQWVEV